ncbi:MAG: hypothetical protein HYS07_09505 [Chlamydiae bacterium]|nr:hypothetical protein [Chlamydiota bacterium]MBI3277073.1 hypothetical protein [Chlamydiota bacterium]
MPPSQSRISFTSRASAKIKEYLLRDAGKGVRFLLEQGRYVIGLDDPDRGDTVVSFNEFQVFIDPQSLKYVVGLVVDFVEDGLDGVFELSNAFSADGECHEKKGGCGCNKKV